MAVVGQRGTRVFARIGTYEAVAHQRRSDNSRGDRVHANTVGAEEVGHAGGNTEHTGYRWSASSWNCFDRRTCQLTLGRAVREATSGNWPSDGRGNVDDATPLFLGAGTKRPIVRVLAVNGIRDDGVDGEGAVGVHVEHLGKVLKQLSNGVHAKYGTTGTPHLCRVNQLVGPCPGRGNGGAVNTTGQAALGDDLEGRAGGGAERIDV